ncbi:hypothetical protein O3637_08380, partial [Streptococcus pseudopneumoniae]
GNFFKPHQLGQFYLRPQNLCFGQAGFSFLVCSLIFIEYKIADKTITIIGHSRANVGRRIAP